MKIIQSIAVVGVCTLLGSAVWAADQDDHKAHHSDVATSSNAAKNDKNAAKTDGKAVLVNEPMAHESMAQESMQKMDNEMKAMQEMHEKIMNAKNPEERKALMAQHMKAMQSGMMMMSDTSKMCSVEKPDTMPRSEMITEHKMMEKRMQMMEAMIQMVVDRINGENYDEYTEHVLRK